MMGGNGEKSFWALFEEVSNVLNKIFHISGGFEIFSQTYSTMIDIFNHKLNSLKIVGQSRTFQVKPHFSCSRGNFFNEISIFF